MTQIYDVYKRVILNKMHRKMTIKIQERGWRDDGPVAKSVYHSLKGVNFGSQYPPLTLVPGIQNLLISVGNVPCTLI